VVINCATLPDHLIQSELFGHVKGSFSGAERNRAGLVAQAEGGTLVLDEIGEASPSLQANLLRLLQEKESRPVGSDRILQVDVRFVAATNRHLLEEVQAGRFREDLYARLNRCVVRMPPLRERREDILPLARHFVATLTGKPPRFTPALALALLRFGWPGNARSLQTMVERMAIEQGCDEPLSVPSWLESELQQLVRCGRDSGQPVVAASQVPQPNRPQKADIQAALQRNGGNVSDTAESMGVARNTLYRWLKKWDIDPNDSRD